MNWMRQLSGGRDGKNGIGGEQLELNGTGGWAGADLDSVEGRWRRLHGAAQMRHPFSVIGLLLDYMTCTRGPSTWFDPEGKRRILPNVYRPGRTSLLHRIERVLHEE